MDENNTNPSTQIEELAESSATEVLLSGLSRPYIVDDSVYNELVDAANSSNLTDESFQATYSASGFFARESIFEPRQSENYYSNERFLKLLRNEYYVKDRVIEIQRFGKIKAKLRTMKAIYYLYRDELMVKFDLVTRHASLRKIEIFDDWGEINYKLYEKVYNEFLTDVGVDGSISMQKEAAWMVNVDGITRIWFPNFEDTFVI